MDRPRVYLIDGNAYLHRAYHALPPLTTSKGESVNAVYGFLRLLLKIYNSEKPEYLGVCFDYPARNFRHGIYQEYKAHRREIDAELKSQMPLARGACSALGIPHVEKEGFEADDIIATLARQAAGDGADVVIVSGDKDVLQLVNGNITVWNESKGIRYTPEEVSGKYGLPPEMLVDMFALMGDASDNVPGIRGIGEKTAVSLLQRSGSLEKVLSDPSAASGRIAGLIDKYREDALKSRELVRLSDTVPLESRWDDLKRPAPDRDAISQFLSRLEFNSLLNEILPPGEAARACAPAAARDIQVHIAAEDDLPFIAEQIRKAGKVSLDTETDSLDPFKAGLVGISAAWNETEGWYIPVMHSDLGVHPMVPLGSIRTVLGAALSDPKVRYIGHNCKYDMHILERHGFSLNDPWADTMIASYCLNPSRSSHSLKDLVADIFHHPMTRIEEIIGRGAKQVTMDRIPVETAAPYAVADAVTTMWLAGTFFEELKKKGLESLFFSMEMPMVSVLKDMEKQGVKVDSAYLGELSAGLEKDSDAISKELMALAGQEFNPNSPKQISVILFEKLKLPVIRRTKTGLSTDEDALTRLSSQHPLPAKLIQYRELQKLRSTYVEALIALSDPGTGRVHTSFNQAVTATGRLSSSEPNLQNIPIRSEYGKKIRRAFIAEKGNILISADYSQIDLRALAHLSGDPALAEAFRNGEDIHEATAREIFNVQEVPQEMRRVAKSINFGIVYGMSPFGLSQQLGIPVEKAKQYIDHYFTRYSGVREWIDRTLNDARRNNFVTTLAGRVRYIPEINSSNGQVRGFAERMAMNTPVQGTSADIIKQAMIGLSRQLREKNMKARMLLQVHDELVFELPEEELQTAVPLIRKSMEQAVRLDVPLTVEIAAGTTWADL